MKRRIHTIIAMLLIVVALVSGCSNSQSNQSNTTANGSSNTSGTDNSGTDTPGTDTSGTNSSDATSDGTGSTTTTTIMTSSEVVIDKEFTANDLDIGYEESTATHITLGNNSIEVSGDGASAKGSILTISNEGTYVVAGTLTEGQIVVNAGEKDKVQIVLNGVSITNSSGAPIYIKNADKAFITLKEGSENNLTDGKEYIQTDDNTVDAVIFSTADLTINGSGSLNITGNYKHGIVSKDDLVVTGGYYKITAVKDALNGKDSVKIQNGTFVLNTTEGNGIQSKNSDDTTKGYVYIAGGKITINHSKEGIEGTAIIIEDGTIDITASDDGLNASSGSSSMNATINATTGTATSTESNNYNAENLSLSNKEETTLIEILDGITSATTDSTNGQPAMGGEDGSGMHVRPDRGGFGGGGGGMENDANCYIAITGGTIKINAEGDGIDSNGSLTISGGTIYVSGPTNSGNAALDYNGTADITGGTVVIAGSAGMAQGFSETSTQYSILNNFTSVVTAGTEITLEDKEGNVLVSYTPDKEYQSVVISTPQLAKDQTYTLTSGSQTVDLTLTSIVTSNGQQAMGGFGRKGMTKPGN